MYSEKKDKILQLKKAILKLENPYPKDDLILTYSDFLKVRDYLVLYQFNSTVFQNLVQLANAIWNTKKRVSRLSLLQKIKQYLYQGGNRSNNSHLVPFDFKPNVETKKLLFVLFRKTFEEKQYISKLQLEDARRICSSLLINIELTPNEQEWLCANFFSSNVILNRILRYPQKSEVISNWAKVNYNNDRLRGRRAELLSWIIDQEPAFEVEHQTLIDDFEYLNQIDQQAIKNYDDEIAAKKIIEEQFGEYLPLKRYYDFLEERYHEEKVELYLPDLQLSKRPYSFTLDSSKQYPVNIPDFKILRETFYTNLTTHQKFTMIWAIGYSRLDNTLKYSLLKKYYRNETHYSLFKVGKRTNNIALLKWILERQ